MGTDLCMDCLGVIDNAYIEAKRYIYQNQGETNFIEVVENTYVSAKALNYLIDTGRLEIGKPGSDAQCRLCGAAISTGSLCDSCMRKILSNKPDFKWAPPKTVTKKADKSQSVPLNYRRQD